MDYEKDVLRMISTYPTRYWLFIYATKYISDGEKAEQTWRKFIKIEFINNGQFLIPEN
ncbi:MAG: hypothetical protein IJU76_03380 [Desulfovibrionaceae bacterium]|nr:hypothetical protein [Desulfovibrionaceae bacterium]